MNYAEHDFNDMARRIDRLPDLVKSGDFAMMCQALDSLRDLPFPPGYLAEVRDDMMKVLMKGRRVTTYVYLSYYGQDERASHLKIGIAKSVKSRLSGIKAGNPLLRLWTWTARFPSRQAAASVEEALLRHMSADRAHGEWINMRGAGELAAVAVTRSLAEVASSVAGYPVEFERHGE